MLALYQTAKKRELEMKCNAKSQYYKDILNTNILYFVRTRTESEWERTWGKSVGAGEDVVKKGKKQLNMKKCRNKEEIRYRGRSIISRNV